MMHLGMSLAMGMMVLFTFGAGYHFQHFSDAGMYGSDARGVDMHLLELIYWFDTK